MKIVRFFCLVLLQMICFCSVHGQDSPGSIDAYQVINQSIEAMGGKEYLESIQTLYSDVKTQMGGRQVHWIVKEMKPNKGSFQITYNKKVVYHNWFDGQNGYEIVGGQKRQADAEEFKDKVHKKNIFNELDYIDSSLWTLKLMGVASVNGEQCYKISVISVDGSVRTLYYSKASLLLLKEEKLVNSEKDNFSTVVFSGYKKFGKLTYYTEMKLGGNGGYQTATIEKLLVNTGVSVNDFK
jgi:hypothetical protein